MGREQELRIALERAVAELESLSRIVSNPFVAMQARRAANEARSALSPESNPEGQ